MRAVEAWIEALGSLITTDHRDRYPTLAAALGERSRNGPMIVAQFLACGWTLDQVEGRFIRAVAHMPPTLSGAPWGSGEVLGLFERLAHLPPEEFDAWSTVYGHDLTELATTQSLLVISVWRASVPGPLAAFCAAAGMAPSEAAAMHADGTLDADAVRALAALQAPIDPTA